MLSLLIQHWNSTHLLHRSDNRCEPCYSISSELGMPKNAVASAAQLQQSCRLSIMLYFVRLKHLFSNHGIEVEIGLHGARYNQACPRPLRYSLLAVALEPKVCFHPDIITQDQSRKNVCHLRSLEVSAFHIHHLLYTTPAAWLKRTSDSRCLTLLRMETGGPALCPSKKATQTIRSSGRPSTSGSLLSCFASSLQ